MVEHNVPYYKETWSLKTIHVWDEKTSYRETIYQVLRNQDDEKSEELMLEIRDFSVALQYYLNKSQLVNIMQTERGK